MFCNLLRTGPFEYYYVVTLEIQFSCSSGIAEFCLLEVATIYLVIFQPFFPKVYSLVCVVIEVSILLALQPFSDLTKISFKKKKKCSVPLNFPIDAARGNCYNSRRLKPRQELGCLHQSLMLLVD